MERENKDEMKMDTMKCRHAGRFRAEDDDDWRMVSRCGELKVASEAQPR